MIPIQAAVSNAFVPASAATAPTASPSLSESSTLVHPGKNGVAKTIPEHFKLSFDAAEMRKVDAVQKNVIDNASAEFCKIPPPSRQFSINGLESGVGIFTFPFNVPGATGTPCKALANIHIEYKKLRNGRGIFTLHGMECVSRNIPPNLLAVVGNIAAHADTPHTRLDNYIESAAPIPLPVGDRKRKRSFSSDQEIFQQAKVSKTDVLTNEPTSFTANSVSRVGNGGEVSDSARQKSEATPVAVDDSPLAEFASATSSIAGVSGESSTENEFSFKDLNPHLAQYLSSLNLVSSDLVDAEFSHSIEHPAFLLALHNLSTLLKGCMAPGFYTLNFLENGQMGKFHGLTEITPGDHHADISFRISQKGSIEQQAGRLLAVLWHEIWDHGLPELNVEYIRSRNFDIANPDETERHHELLSPQYARTIEQAKRHIENDEMREAFWQAVRSDVNSQILDLENIPSDIEENACDHYSLDIEEDFSSDDEVNIDPSH